MRHAMWILAALTYSACGGSEPEASPPAQAAPAAQTQTPPAAPAPRRPTFPAADQFRLGEAVALRGGAPAQCQKLFFRDSPVAVVETWIHNGNGAVARRCVGNAWAQTGEPTTAQLAQVGATLEGRLADDFDALAVDADGNLTFQPLGLSDRITELSLAGRFAAYATTANPRDSEVDVVGVVFDLPARFPLQQYLLGTCQLRGSQPLSLAAPTWSSDGRAVVFHGIETQCSFTEVETHPE